MKQTRRTTTPELRSSFIVRVSYQAGVSIITVHNLHSKEVLTFQSWETLLGYLSQQSGKRMLK